MVSNPEEVRQLSVEEALEDMVAPWIEMPENLKDLQIDHLFAAFRQRKEELFQGTVDDERKERLRLESQILRDEINSRPGFEV
jgi:hypothetical protein